jgi:heme A synthase
VTALTRGFLHAAPASLLLWAGLVALAVAVGGCREWNTAVLACPTPPICKQTRPANETFQPDWTCKCALVSP